ncbi:MAG: 3-deoxy-D-manno-octulosonic acid transferase [Sulfitobacter sp.]|nr:3-deoxy-D-manno-octulosonic acid transferase [Sulfitobacter sp.]
MARSLGLTAYRALARRAEIAARPCAEPRPRGELLWLHAGEPGNALALQDLALRIGAARPGLSLLITAEEGLDLPPLTQRMDLHVFQEAAPSEHPQSVIAFLDHWQPDLCLWAWGRLRPNLIIGAAERGCELVLIDADSGGFDGRRDRWLPDLTRRVLSQFGKVFARSAGGRKRLVQLGLKADEVEVTAPLLAGGQPLPCADSDLEELAEAIKGRPVWFATQILPKEVPTVLAAHEQALRLSHRLMLILNPASAKDGKEIFDMAADLNMVPASWSDGEFPDDSTQVLVAEDPADRGLFFRIAPVSFLGSSLVAGTGGCDPFDAATLGSAVLYGPKVRNYLPSYTRLAAAGAARIVNDADALGTAVSRLIAPDQAATMAHAGWDVISQGAEIADRIAEAVQDRLDARVSKG